MCEEGGDSAGPTRSLPPPLTPVPSPRSPAPCTLPPTPPCALWHQGLCTIPTDFHAPLPLVAPWPLGGPPTTSTPPPPPPPLPGPDVTQAIMTALRARIDGHGASGRGDVPLATLLAEWADEVPLGTPAKPWSAEDEAYVVDGEVGVRGGLRWGARLLCAR
jgi:hypothetical protein